VIKVLNTGLLVRPLWTRGKEKEVPLIECKIVSANVPEALRKQVQELYPNMQWRPVENESEPKGIADYDASTEIKSKKRHRKSVADLKGPEENQ